MLMRGAAALLLAWVAASAQGPAQPTIRITVTLVQIDAVVTDAAGRHIADLTKDDFVLYQDGKRREITRVSYAGGELPAPVTGRLESPAAPKLRPENARRILALVVDDLSLSFPSVSFVRDALRKFVDEQVKPGDLVAILRTGAGIGALQQFTTDKRLLHASIDRVRWNLWAPIAAFAPLGGGSSVGPGLGLDTGRVHSTNWDRNADSESEVSREQAFTTGTLGTLDYLIRGLRDLRGRKSVIVFSDGFRLFQAPKDVQAGNYRPELALRLRRLTDLANRSAVVVNAIDMRGLVSYDVTASDDVGGMGSAAELQGALDDRRDGLLARMEGMEYLARQTGGKFWKHTNDFAGAARSAADDLEGYYLLGYNPGSDAFDSSGGKSKYHRVRVEVKRPGLRVRTRAGFFGIPDDEARPVYQGRAAQLAAALTSPFGSGGIGLRLTALFGNAAQTGSYVRALLHIDARGLTFEEDGAGGRKAVVDIAAMTFGAEGVAAGSSTRTYTVRLEEKDYASALRWGLLYTLLHPVKTAGPYQLRAAVRDAASGKTGSASQFIEIPDVAKGRLAISGIVMHGGRDPGAETEGATPAPTDPSAGPALRVFRPGAPIFYGFVVYNARFGAATKKPDVEIRTRVYRDGKQVWAGAPFSMAASTPEDARRMRAGQQLSFGPATPAGEYLLQVAATDKLTGKTALEWMDFELVR